MCIHCDIDRQPKRHQALLHILAVQFHETQVAFLRRGVSYFEIKEIARVWWTEIVHEVMRYEKAKKG